VANRPEAGGGYVYLREAFSPQFGFFYGWKVAFITATGAIAALAITFADYAIDLFGLGGSWSVPIAVAAIVFLSGINYFGVQFGSLTQNIFTVLKLGALAGLVGTGLWLGTGELTTAETAAHSVRARGHVGGARRVRGGPHARPLRTWRLAARQPRRRGNHESEPKPAALSAHRRRHSVGGRPGLLRLSLGALA
jgi:hypothetical protein